MKYAALVLVMSSLAACQKAAPPPPEEGQRGGAQGEVLEGTISDNMLPLDVVIQPDVRPAVVVDGEATSTGGAADSPPPAAEAAPTEEAEPAGDAEGEETAPDQSSEG